MDISDSRVAFTTENDYASYVLTHPVNNPAALDLVQIMKLAVVGGQESDMRSGSIMKHIYIHHVLGLQSDTSWR